MYLMEPYDDALREILKNGVKKADRTGVGTIGVAGLQRKYPLHHQTFQHKLTMGVPSPYSCYFPIITGRRVYPRSVFAELIWFLSGSTKNQDLVDLGAKFWGLWCDENNVKYRTLREKYGYEPGDFGPIYGWQLRHFGADYLRLRRAEREIRKLRAELTGGTDPQLSLTINQEIASWEKIIPMIKAGGFDQLAFMIDVLKNDPYGSNGRRCLFSLWNPNDLEKMALPPCHYTYQAIADGDGGLTGILTQRSCDFPVGVPANIQFYSALTIMLAQQAQLTPREFIHNTNDSHIYLNQIEQVEEYLSRPKPDSPKLTVHYGADIYSYRPESFVVSDYNPLDKIDVPVAV